MPGKKNEIRVETDESGEVRIPASAYWGIRTARSCELDNSQGCSQPAQTSALHPKFIDALVILRKASALANAEAGRLDMRLAVAIGQAADEVVAGQWRDQFVVEPLQHRAVVATMYNIDEVLANRASEILGGAVAEASLVHPIMHVSGGAQPITSYANAARIAILFLLKELEPVLLDTERLLRRKALEFARFKVEESERPVSFGAQFNCYGASVERGHRRIREASAFLADLALSPTSSSAVSEERGDPALAERLSQLTGFKLRPADDYVRSTQSTGDYLALSSALKEMSTELIRVASDMRRAFVDSHSETACGGATSPEKGLDTLVTSAFRIIGNDTTISLASQASDGIIQTTLPLVTNGVYSSIDLLKLALSAFNKNGICAISPQEPPRRAVEEVV